MTELNTPVPMDDWGKDHWSLLAYLVTRFDGDINPRHLRCNPDRHPFTHGGGWKDSYSTRLDVGILSGHDDWDCLDDLESEGLVEVVSAVNGIVKLTERGNALSLEIRRHKANGGTFATFKR